MEFINEPFVSYFVASDYVEVICIKKYGMGLKTSSSSSSSSSFPTFMWGRCVLRDASI